MPKELIDRTNELTIDNSLYIYYHNYVSDKISFYPVKVTKINSSSIYVKPEDEPTIRFSKRARLPISNFDSASVSTLTSNPDYGREMAEEMGRVDSIRSKLEQLKSEVPKLPIKIQEQLKKDIDKYLYNKY